MKRPPLTKYEKQMRAALREAIAIYDFDEPVCSDCGCSTHDHDETCIVTMMHGALKRPKK